MSTRWFIGLASGSCLEGVNATLLETDGVGLGLRARPIHSLHLPYSRELRELILRASADHAELSEMGLLHRLLGETFATAARLVADQASFSLQRVQCIGCPGHAVWQDGDGRFPSSLQLGMAAVVAERTGVTTISDFRDRDIAAGGLGASILALIDHLLFQDLLESRVLLHLGGVARIVYLPAGGEWRDVLAFEAGPCNGLLNALMRHLTNGREHFDPGGKYAVQGRCIESLLARWLAHPFLQRRPPKVLSRQTFADSFARQIVQEAVRNGWSMHDLLCTSTHFVAEAIVQSLKRFVLPSRSGERPHRFLLSGGGVRNGLLWNLLEQSLADAELNRTDEFGVPAMLRKSLAFGMMAALTMDGVPANLPTVSGAAGARILGSITPGSTNNWSRCLHWLVKQAALPEETLV
ncbi:MAG: anhydro-N-acetylmuramic acid kinase [Gemmatales bacterium]|nr:MAG: anhydro-N-acetylmuramic acid kinase [Gemmatales bacterium]